MSQDPKLPVAPVPIPEKLQGARDVLSKAKAFTESVEKPSYSLAREARQPSFSEKLTSAARGVKSSYDQWKKDNAAQADDTAGGIDWKIKQAEEARKKNQ
jgi:hypothetical protein